MVMTKQPPSDRARVVTAAGLGMRTAVAAVLWVVLTEGDVRDAWIGAAVSFLAAFASYLPVPAGRLPRVRLPGLLRFIRYFFVQSWRGGWDVSRRALKVSMPVQPGFQTCRLELACRRNRVLLAWVVSLLPGTASVGLEEDRLTIHLLNDDHDAGPDIRELEGLIRNAWGD